MLGIVEYAEKLRIFRSILDTLHLCIQSELMVAGASSHRTGSLRVQEHKFAPLYLLIFALFLSYIIPALQILARNCYFILMRKIIWEPLPLAASHYSVTLEPRSFRLHTHTHHVLKPDVPDCFNKSCVIPGKILF